MPLNIIRNDITKMNVDVIVNAANTELKAGGGVCGAIFNAAGADKLQKACDKLVPVKTGEAVITKGFALPAKYIIHTAGPVYQGGNQNEEELLRACYKNSLDLARKKRCKSIAFPLISSGIYGYPKEEALSVATSTISEWLNNNYMDISLVVFDKAAFSISQKLRGDVKSFIDENYVDERMLRYHHERSRSLAAPRFDDYTDQALKSPMSVFDDTSSLFVNATQAPPQPDSTATSSFCTKCGMKLVNGSVFCNGCGAKQAPSQSLPQAAPPMPSPPSKIASIDRLVGKLDEPFSTTLLRIIDAKGKTDAQVYKRANIDRKLFSKIRVGKGYMPSKKTVVALAVALELSLPETKDLLERAGFALSRSVMFDVIIEYFITRRKYDIFEINNVLFEYDQQLLGG